MADQHEVEAVKSVATQLLSHILSHPPFIPASLKSDVLNQRHQILDVQPDDEGYLFSNVYGAEPGTASRVLDLLSSLQAQVEQLHGISTAGNQGTIVGQVKFSSPERSFALACVKLGSAAEAAPLLDLLLRKGRIGSEEEWRFDNLLPAGTAPGTWHDSYDTATGSRARSISTDSTNLVSQPPTFERQPSFNSEATNVTSASFNTAGTHFTSEQEQDEQDKAEYITDADEFWADVADDEHDAEAAAEDAAVEDEDNVVDEQAEDDAYWASYDLQGPSVGQQLDPGTPDGSTRGAPPTAGSVVSRDFSQPGRALERAEQRELSNAPEQEQMVPGGLTTEYVGAISSEERSAPAWWASAPHLAKLRQQTMSPRSDATEYGTDGTAPTESVGTATAVPGSAISAAGEDEDDIAPTSENDGTEGTTVDSTFDSTQATYHYQEQDGASIKAKQQDELVRQEQEEAKDEVSSPRRPRAGSYLKDEDVTAALFPPRAPGSVVSAVSTYETPEDMDLKALEDFYRRRDIQRQEEQRERIRRGGQLPGVIDPNPAPRVQHDSPKKQASMPDLKSEHDPVTALGIITAPEKKEAKTVVHGASMEVLRRLATAQEDEADERPQDDDAKSASGVSRASFRNFLQMTPSEVTDITSADFSLAPAVDSPSGSAAYSPGDEPEASAGPTPADSTDDVSSIASRRLDMDEPFSLSQQRSPSDSRLSSQDDDLNRSSASDNRKRQTHAIDSPQASENDSLVREVTRTISLKKPRAVSYSPGSSSGVAASDSFLPGASSDASMRPHVSSIIMNPRDSPDSINSGPMRGVKVVGFRSHLKSKPLSGTPEGDEESSIVDDDAQSVSSMQQQRGYDDEQSESVALSSPGAGMAPVSIDESLNSASNKRAPVCANVRVPPGSTSVRTANLRQEHLRQQRQQALQVQKERIQQQRNRGRRPDSGSSKDPGYFNLNIKPDGTPLPLARGAQQRQPFPANGRGGRGRMARRPSQLRMESHITQNTQTTSSTDRTTRGSPQSKQPKREEAEEESENEEEPADENQEDNEDVLSTATDLGEEEEEEVAGLQAEHQIPEISLSEAGGADEEERTSLVSDARQTENEDDWEEAEDGEEDGDGMPDDYADQQLEAEEQRGILLSPMPSESVMSPVPPSVSQSFSLSPANATVAGSIQRQRLGARRPSMERKQSEPRRPTVNEARAQAAQNARNRREAVLAIKRRDEAAKRILTGAWELMEVATATIRGSGGTDGELAEGEWIRICREVAREQLALRDGSTDPNGKTDSITGRTRGVHVGALDD